MIDRYERKRVSPRVLLHLVEGAFTRGRIKKRQSVIYQRRSVLAQRLRLEQGPSTPSKFHGLAATPGIFADGAPPPPPQTTPTPPAPPPPSPASEASSPARAGVRVGGTTVNLSPTATERRSPKAPPPEAVALVRDAAGRGYAEAEYHLADLHLEGAGGVPQDTREAKRLFANAAGKGYDDARAKLAALAADAASAESVGALARVWCSGRELGAASPSVILCKASATAPSPPSTEFSTTALRVKEPSSSLT